MEIAGQYARLAARLFVSWEQDPTDLYKKAIHDSAIGGWNTEEHKWCLLEALAYSVWADKKVAFKHFWDSARKSALFGYNVGNEPSVEVKTYIHEVARGYPLSVPLARIYYSES